MGGNSTSNSAALGSRIEKVHSFDLLSWQGLTDVLRAGKESIKDPHAYSDFRNLILEYAQKGGDEELKNKIHVIVKNFKTEVQAESFTVVPEVAVSPKMPEAPVVHIDASVDITPTISPQKIAMLQRRPEPSFLPHAMIEKEAENTIPDNLPVYVDETDKTNIEVDEQNTGRQEKIENAVSEVVLEVKSSEVETTPVPEPVPEVIAPITKADFVEMVSTKSTEAPVFKSMDEYKARITEIKRMVHDTVGNPAALMDTQNDAGKRYMFALLTALKATGAGSPVGIETAMSALESAYTNLIGETHKKSEVVAAGDEVVVSTDAILQSEDAQESDFETNIETHDEDVRDESAAPTDVQSNEVTHIAEVQSDVIVQKEIETRKEVPVWQSNKHIQKSIDLKKHVDLTDIRTTLAAEKSVHQSELSTPEISKSLDSLLHEWSIFTGSGILGIGPGGVEHPLYQKLANLSMGEVLSGRWEKADPKVVRMIKEYVDAWRHEQGIAYTIHETFEHYLRRVVQRILKRQQG